MKSNNGNLKDVMILLDRDGTLNRNYRKEPVYRIELFELLPGAAEAVRSFNDLGVRVAVVTNQGGINHEGRSFDLETYKKIEDLMHERLLAESGAFVDDVFMCPHADYENCDCRKPKTGLLRMAREKYGFDPGRSYMVGDSEADIIAGKDFGVNTILVESGWDKTVADKLSVEGVRPDHIFSDLLAAAKFIVKQIKNG